MAYSPPTTPSVGFVFTALGYTAPVGAVPFNFIASPPGLTGAQQLAGFGQIASAAAATKAAASAALATFAQVATVAPMQVLQSVANQTVLAPTQAATAKVSSAAAAATALSPPALSGFISTATPASASAAQLVAPFTQSATVSGNSIQFVFQGLTYTPVSASSIPFNFQKGQGVFTFQVLAGFTQSASASAKLSASGATTLAGFAQSAALASSMSGAAAAVQSPNTAYAFGGPAIAAGAATQAKNVAAQAGGVLAVGASAVTQAKNVVASVGTPVAGLVGDSTQALNTSASAGTVVNNATLGSAQRANAASASGFAEFEDPYFESVVLLLHADHTDNLNPNWVDSSASHKPLTAVGSVSTMNAESYSDPLVAARFGAAGGRTFGGYLSATHASDFSLGTGDFTVEGWVRLAGQDPEVRLFELRNASTPVLTITTSQNGQISASAGTGTTIGGPFSPPALQWIHWAYTRRGQNFSLWLDGVEYPNGAPFAGAVPAATEARVGSNSSYTGSAQFDDVRVTKGLARYTSYFLTPTAAFPSSGSLTSRSLSAAQTLGQFVQSASLFGAGSRTATSSKTLAPFAQVAYITPPSRVVVGASQFNAFAQVAAAITTADRNLNTPGDIYFDNVALLLHLDSQSPGTGSGNAYNAQPDSSAYAIDAKGEITGIVTDPLAFGGAALAFAKTGTSAVHNFVGRPTIYDRRTNTTEFRVRFDVLNGVIQGTPDPNGGPGDYVFDATQQQTGWFYAGERLSLGLAGHNGLYEADWTFIQASGNSLTFAPYVLQMKGYVSVAGPSSNDLYVNSFGVTPVTVGWHDISIVQEPDRTYVYMDGVLEFSFALVPNFSPLSEYFILGADTSLGFFFRPEHTNLSAADEFRFTVGVARHPARPGVRTGPFPSAYAGPIPGFTQTASAIHDNSRRLASTQQLAGFTQSASCFTGAALVASASQQVPAFTQAASLSGIAPRLLGAVRALPPPAQLATVAEPRTIDDFFGGATVAPVAQVAALTSTAAASAAQVLALAQGAEARHTPRGGGAAQTFVIAQAATASTLLALTQGQIIVAFGQSAQGALRANLTGATTIGGFVLAGIAEGAFISRSVRGYRIRPEARTFGTS